MGSLDQTLFRFMEELRFRRKNSGDLNEKIKQLRSEILKLEEVLEEKEQKCKQWAADHEMQALEIKKAANEKCFEFEFKYKQLKTTLDITERELAIAKEELFKLKLEKFDHEKKVDDLERRMQTNSSNKESQLAAFATFQQRLQRLQATVKELFEHVRRLSSSVEQSKKFHDDLEKLCSHKDCEIRSALERENSIRSAFIDAQAELKLVNWANLRSTENENKCRKCAEDSFKIDQANQKIESLNDELMSSKNEITKFVELLATGQEILQKEISIKESAENELLKIKRETNELQTRYESTKKEIDDLKKILTIEIEPLDEKSMKILISNLKTQLEIEKNEIRLEQNLVDSVAK